MSVTLLTRSGPISLGQAARMPPLAVTDIRRLCTDRGWNNGRLMLAMRQAAQYRGVPLPDDEHLKRTVSRWRNGRTTALSRFYADLLSDVFGVPFTTGRPVGAR